MATATDTTMLNAALDYASRGWRVVPLHTPTAEGGCDCRRSDCPHPGKHPRLLEWQREASADPATIERWWSMWAGANVGVLLGECSDIIDMECDSPDAERALIDIFGAPPPVAPTYRSQRGKHRLFRRAAGLPAKATQHVEGVEFRIGGGHRGAQSVMPPSQHASGCAYEWLPGLSPDDVDPAELPAAVVERVRAAAGGAGTNGKPLATPVGDKIPEGQRDDTLTSLAGTMRRRGMDADEIEAALAAVNSKRCDPPLDEKDIQRIAQSVARYAPAETIGDASDDELGAVFADEHAADNGHAQESGPTEDDGHAAPMRTDMGNAQRFAAQHRADVRYVFQWAKWLAWDGRRWAADEVGDVDRRAKKTSRSIWNEVAAEEDAEERDELKKWAAKSESAERIAAMIRLARSEPGIPIRPADLDADPWALNVLNGTIDLRTGQLRPHRREDLITKLAPVVYDPKARCPLWIDFLAKILAGNSDLMEFIQRAAGHSLTGDTREQCLFFLHGAGANGKSTLVNTILAMLGEYAKQSPPDLLTVKRDAEHPTALADLCGARFVACVETEDGKRLAENLVKQMTGGDRMKARRMREDFWEFQPTHKIWLAANHKPTVRGTDYAIWRRIRLIPFAVTIPPDEQDKTLPDKLRAELPGILNWAIEGCLEWQQHGLGEPDEVRMATDGYRAEMDVIASFIAECCVTAEHTWVSVAELHKTYCDWSGDKWTNQRIFGRKLAEKGFDRRRATGGTWVWDGLGLVASGI